MTAPRVERKFCNGRRRCNRSASGRNASVLAGTNGGIFSAELHAISIGAKPRAARRFFVPPGKSRSPALRESASSLLALSDRLGAAESGSKLHALQTLREIGLRLDRAAPYRGFEIRSPAGQPNACRRQRRFARARASSELGDTADCKSALRRARLRHYMKQGQRSN